MPDVQNTHLDHQPRVRPRDEAPSPAGQSLRDVEAIAREEVDYVRVAELTEAEARLSKFQEFVDGMGKILQRRRNALEAQRCVYGHPFREGRPYGDGKYHDENNNTITVWSCSAACDHKMKWEMAQNSLKLLKSREMQNELDRNAAAVSRRRRAQGVA